ncbi:hypothetical protein E0H22_24855 [Rhodopseudomonas boonkerdii]|jgi:hypothetical protein|uniref:hypothetical protein n=1 Tax=Hyphomicrobiales TaxID=356 RepID=UPI000BC9BD98|nr:MULTISPECIES: hypothetical protein [Hyphomicrobiales]MCX7322358.1 hypothetical protein [Hyphomicrobiales bacterium]OYU91154.1 MAG: hypothetical protein CFE29_10230 [Bradyrhizobiaceae bacterium PARB1]KAB2760784.1 hypothetical protein F9K81_04930 [Brucella anthropi]UGV24879.1 hypothetical protein E0H22_03815 [Rhodopseudomonas boonkerdii]UGV28597.1 hypothetical protein E0H22_24855 [Rhodopseudomonas boonkerdii]
MASEAFEEVVATATADAFASRKELGCNYAAEFREDPESFDPRKLIPLGKEGLLSFVTTVSVPTRGIDTTIQPEVEVELTEQTSADLGWRDKQTVPLPFEISALLFGALAGIGIVFGLAIALTI